MRHFYIILFRIYVFIFGWAESLLLCKVPSCGKWGPLCCGVWTSHCSAHLPCPLWSTGSRYKGSVVVVHGLSCHSACGILPEPGSNPCLLHWQMDSQPLDHSRSPIYPYMIVNEYGVEEKKVLSLQLEFFKMTVLISTTWISPSLHVYLVHLWVGSVCIPLCLSNLSINVIERQPVCLGL